MSSTLALLTAGLAALAPVASAVFTASGDSPSGNAIYTPGLDEVVPAGKAYKITWDPTTSGNVSLQLCHGPSTNCVITATIADSIDNSGSYEWTPSTDLEPSQPTGYGIELVAANGSYQYSTQFGISNAEYDSSSSSSKSSVSESSSSSSSSASASSSSAEASSASSASASSASSVSATAVATTTASSGNATSSVFHGTGYAASSGWGSANATYVKPTGSTTVPSSLLRSTKTVTSSATADATDASATSGTAASGTASATSTATGAAMHLCASFGGLVFAAGIAVLAF